MAYYVYDNWRRNRGRIHIGDCSYCNNGRGTQETDSGQNGEWHGPYEDRALAFNKAESLDRADMSACRICAP